MAEVMHNGVIQSVLLSLLRTGVVCVACFVIFALTLWGLHLIGRWRQRNLSRRQQQRTKAEQRFRQIWEQHAAIDAQTAISTARLEAAFMEARQRIRDEAN
ncbi:hypothetical protein [Nocardia salmonicida]|uniref:hypothetical protein n=1 Tax=Nocardia salmonicida TaxID=53431 RepID=UPI0033F61841